MRPPISRRQPSRSRRTRRTIRKRGPASLPTRKRGADEPADQETGASEPAGQELGDQEPAGEGRAVQEQVTLEESDEQDTGGPPAGGEQASNGEQPGEASGGGQPGEASGGSPMGHPAASRRSPPLTSRPGAGRSTCRIRRCRPRYLPRRRTSTGCEAPRRRLRMSPTLTTDRDRHRAGRRPAPAGDDLAGQAPERRWLRPRRPGRVNQARHAVRIPDTGTTHGEPNSLSSDERHRTARREPVPRRRI